MELRQNLKTNSKTKEVLDMTKGDLINVVARAAKMSKSGAEGAIDVTFAALARAIKTDTPPQMTALGTLSVKSPKARIVSNARTGELLNIKDSRIVGL